MPQFGEIVGEFNSSKAIEETQQSLKAILLQNMSSLKSLPRSSSRHSGRDNPRADEGHRSAEITRLDPRPIQTQTQQTDTPEHNKPYDLGDPSEFDSNYDIHNLQVMPLNPIDREDALVSKDLISVTNNSKQHSKQNSKSSKVHITAPNV